MVFTGQFHWYNSSLKELNPSTGLGMYLQEFGSSENLELLFSVFRDILRGSGHTTMKHCQMLVGDNLSTITFRGMCLDRAPRWFLMVSPDRFLWDGGVLGIYRIGLIGRLF